MSSPAAKWVPALVFVGIACLCVGLYSVFYKSESASIREQVQVISSKQQVSKSIKPCGMLLDEYCRAKYGFDSSSVLVENTALGWRCESREIGNRRLIKIDMNDVCRVQHGSQSKAIMSDVSDFESWDCTCPMMYPEI